MARAEALTMRIPERLNNDLYMTLSDMQVHYAQMGSPVQHHPGKGLWGPSDGLRRRYEWTPDRRQPKC